MLAALSICASAPGLKIMGLDMKVLLAVVASAGLLAGCSTVGKTRDAIVKTAPACEDVTVQVYFEADSAEVTKEGKAVLSQAATLSKGCKVDRVRVLGLADAVGAPAANLELSKKRAAAVTRALADTGLPAAEFDLAAVGQAGAVTTDGEARPLRRRADVTVELSAAK